MKVLVCAASKYGATKQIAQAVAEVLAERGCQVTVLPPKKAGAVKEYLSPGSFPRFGLSQISRASPDAGAQGQNRAAEIWARVQVLFPSQRTRTAR